MLRFPAGNERRYRRELADSVAIPSVSTDAGRADDVRRASSRVAARLRRPGVAEVERWETATCSRPIRSRHCRPGRCVVEAANPTVAGMNGAARSFVDLFHALA